MDKGDVYITLSEGVYRIAAVTREWPEFAKAKSAIMQAALDGKLTHQYGDRLSVSANLGVGYDAIGGQASITSAYAGAPAAGFVTYGLDPGPWHVRGGLGLTYQTNDRTEVTARYDADYRSDFLNQTASVKVRWAF